ncbi:MAG: DsbA family protein [Alphaproteobacteria bacterium]
MKGDLEDDDINKMIRRNMELADALTINGTPAFEIGDTLVRGAVDFPALKSLVERARKTGFSKSL